ncbi:hypothetical protein HDR63_04425, partial [bacterium]|nr:hypothetical protein [bacterium]
AEMFNLDFLSNNSSSNSMTNLRGTELFNAAKKRCNSILTQCKNVGATSDQITANYELAIDKDCIAYEQGLSKMNDNLKSNVRSANLMLQKARLAVQTNKNQYDAKGCIAALETCMTDDMVCGDDYAKCLDPTKKYIDENGEVVLGQNIGSIIDFTSDYENSKINSDFVKSSINAATNTTDGKGIVRYLMEKIGTGDKVTDGGLCRAVLDKCQRYTYDSNNTSKYNPYNDVVVNYIQRAMVNIRAAQSQIISDYASSCMTDIATCYNQQMSQVNAWSSSASVASIYRVMQGACYNVALTCAYAVFHDTKPCEKDEDGKELTDAEQKACLLKNVSEMFYQNMLCPSNSVWDTKGGTIGTRGCRATLTTACFINDHCKCAAGYVIQNGGCYPACDTGKSYATETATTCTDTTESK